MKKIIIIIMMVLITMVSVLAIEPDSTLRINAEYKVDGVYTESTSSITIYLPNGVIDVDEEPMINVSTGRFIYDYPVTVVGSYDVDITFYGDTVKVESSNFVVEEEQEELNVLFYPALIICVLLLIVGFTIKQGLIGILGGLGIVFISFMLTGAFFVITLVGGLLITISSLLIQND